MKLWSRAPWWIRWYALGRHRRGLGLTSWPPLTGTRYAHGQTSGMGRGLVWEGATSFLAAEMRTVADTPPTLLDLSKGAHG